MLNRGFERMNSQLIYDLVEEAFDELRNEGTELINYVELCDNFNELLNKLEEI